ncbi:MAG: PASTA domain-containing protein [Mobilitalea sp.]
MIEKIKKAGKLLVKSTYKTKAKLLLLALIAISSTLYLPKVFAVQVQENKKIDIVPTEIPDNADETINNLNFETDDSSEFTKAEQPDILDDAINDDLKEDNTLVVDIENTDKGDYSEENTNKNGKDLSNDPEYIKELEKKYSKEDLERLQAPSKFVTMPNVVGMTETKALSKMRSLGLAVRVIYLDESSEKEGICYAQDINAGERWNTDASIFIWVQKDDPKKVKEYETGVADDIDVVELEQGEQGNTPEEAETTLTPEVAETTDYNEAIPSTEPSEQANTGE